MYQRRHTDASRQTSSTRVAGLVGYPVPGTQQQLYCSTSKTTVQLVTQCTSRFVTWGTAVKEDGQTQVLCPVPPTQAPP